MDQVLYLAPALEVMHSTGGRGLTENFLGLDTSDDGTGHMYTLATDVKINITDQIGVRAFGMPTWVRSPQVDEMDPLEQSRPPPLPQVGRRAELPGAAQARAVGALRSRDPRRLRLARTASACSRRSSRSRSIPGASSSSCTRTTGTATRSTCAPVRSRSRPMPDSDVVQAAGAGRLVVLIPFAGKCRSRLWRWRCSSARVAALRRRAPMPEPMHRRISTMCRPGP